MGRGGRRPVDDARAEHYAIRVLNHLLFLEGNLAGPKAAFALMGKCANNELRPPIYPVSAGAHRPAPQAPAGRLPR